MQISKTLIISLFLSIIIGNAQAQAIEPQYEIHPTWHMLVCAGFGYQLTLDNNTKVFRLIYSDECPSVIATVYKGKFAIKKSTVVLDFGKFQIHYYIKEPYAGICDNQSNSLTKDEIEFVCDSTQLDSAAEYMPQGNLPPKIFMKKTALFPSKIVGSTKGEEAEWLAKDLKTHIFIVDTNNNSK